MDFEPEVESAKVRRLLLDKFADRFTGPNARPAYLYDGFHNMKELTALDPQQLEVTLETVNETAGGPVAQRIRFKRSEKPVAWGSFEMMRLYSTQMRRNFLHMGWVQIFRDYYDPATRIQMPHFSIDVMLGLTTAINEHDGGILMACETINKIIRRDTVHTMMRQIHQRGGNFQESCRRELVGSIVMTSYNNRTYKIDDIDFSKNPMSTFDRRGRGMVSFVDYYREQYPQMQLTDKQQPLIVCLPSIRDKRAAEQRGQTATTHLLIPEFCVMTGLSDSLRSDFNLKKQLTQSTQLPPADRFNQLHAFRKKLVDNADVRNDLSTWNLRYSEKLVELDGRILPNESLMMGNNKVIPIASPGDFSRDMRSSAMLDPICWSKWVIIFPQRCADVVGPFLESFQRVSRPLGLNVPAPLRKQLNDDRVPSFIAALNELRTPTDGMVVCILPNNNKDRYDAIKKVCCIESPCASQCVLVKTLQKQTQLMSVATKICLQMACKSGSSAWGIPFPAKGTMVIGCDTYHDGARKGESVGAFVCTLNDGLTRYWSKISYHKNKDELSSHMAVSLQQGLEAYKKANGKLPVRVIVYRDGVGEGQIGHVFTVELDEMKKVLRVAAGMDAEIKLGFVIVTKRINTKFFWKNEQTRKLDNPQPGTVVDTVVTRPERLEFYLVAQSVRHGTVAPSNFNVICNEFNWAPKFFQLLSYKLCHMYYNWPGTIRVPSCCQYAHKLAYLTGTSLHREPHAALADKLFFL